MTTIQVTLDLEDSVAEKLKSYAEKKHTDLNALLKAYVVEVAQLQEVKGEETNNDLDLNGNKLSANILALTGIIKGSYNDEEIDNLKYEYLKEKYGL